MWEFLGPRQLIVFGTLLVIAVAVIGFIVVLPVRALLDVSRRSDADFAAIGEDRRTWLIAMLVATFVLGPGWLGALVYLRTVKPRLAERDATSDGPAHDDTAPDRPLPA